MKFREFIDDMIYVLIKFSLALAIAAIAMFIIIFLM